MRTAILLAALSLSLTACSGESAGTPDAAPVAPTAVTAAAEPQAAAAPEPGTRAADAVPAAGADWKTFGTAFTVSAATPVKDLLDAPQGSVGKVVRIEGTIVDTCQKKGCWMVMSDGARQIRVMTKDHAFGVDTNSTGLWADVEGTVIEKAHDAEEAAHLASEAARPELMPEKAGAPTYQLVATAIRTRR